MYWKQWDMHLVLFYIHLHQLSDSSAPTYQPGKGQGLLMWNHQVSVTVRYLWAAWTCIFFLSVCCKVVSGNRQSHTRRIFSVQLICTSSEFYSLASKEPPPVSRSRAKLSCVLCVPVHQDVRVALNVSGLLLVGLAHKPLFFFIWPDWHLLRERRCPKLLMFCTI